MLAVEAVAERWGPGGGVGTGGALTLEVGEGTGAPGGLAGARGGAGRPATNNWSAAVRKGKEAAHHTHLLAAFILHEVLG